MSFSEKSGLNVDIYISFRLQPSDDKTRMRPARASVSSSTSTQMKRPVAHPTGRGSGRKPPAPFCTLPGWLPAGSLQQGPFLRQCFPQPGAPKSPGVLLKCRRTQQAEVGPRGCISPRRPGDAAGPQLGGVRKSSGTVRNFVHLIRARTPSFTCTLHCCGLKDKICSPANQPGQEVQQPDLSCHDQIFPNKTQKPWQDHQECQPTGHSRYGGAGGAEEENKRARANHEVFVITWHDSYLPIHIYNM